MPAGKLFQMGGPATADDLLHSAVLIRFTGLEVWKISPHSAVNRDARHRQNVTTMLIVANNRQLPINTAMANN